MEDSQGAGTVINPRLTYGALDLGGASTQISFYQPDQDVMSNLCSSYRFGQGKHWNLYSAFVFVLWNQCGDRAIRSSSFERKGPYRATCGGHSQPLPSRWCLKDVRTNIHFDNKNSETWSYPAALGNTSGYQLATLNNRNPRGDYDKCSEFVKELLHKDKGDWCQFAHRGDCSFAGIYQPTLPEQSEHFGEFLAFSNYYHVWDFLKLPSRSSLSDLDKAARNVCSMSQDELHNFAGHPWEESDDDTDASVNEMCFRSTYAFQLLHNGYGFKMDDYITATNLVGGQKVGWTLGAIMYEINTLPWHYVAGKSEKDLKVDKTLGTTIFFSALVLGMIFALVSIFRARILAKRSQYQPIKQTEITC